MALLFYPICFAAVSFGVTSCSSCKRNDAPPIPPVPIDIARAAYVTDNGSDEISVIDRESDVVVARPVDLDPTAHEAPHHLAVDPKAKRVFVALAFPPPPDDKAGPHASHGNATDSGKLARLELGTLAVQATADVDENPGDVVLTHDGTKVVVTHFDMKRAMLAAAAGKPPNAMFATLQVWDATTMKKVGSRAICVAPHGVAVTKDDKTAVVACYGSDEIAFVDLSSPQLPTSRFVLGATEGLLGAPKYGPYSATLSPDESTLLVGDLESKDVRFFDMKARKFGSPVDLSARAMIGAWIGASSVVVPLQGPDGVARIDGSQIATRASFAKEQCEAPHAAKVASDGRVFVVCEGDHVHPGAVVEIDPSSLAIKKRWTVGVYPDGIDFGN